MNFSQDCSEPSLYRPRSQSLNGLLWSVLGASGCLSGSPTPFLQVDLCVDHYYIFINVLDMMQDKIIRKATTLASLVLSSPLLTDPV